MPRTSASFVSPDANSLGEMPVLPEPQIAAVFVEKAYRKGDHQVPVLHGVDVSVHKGEFLSIVGQSGSGKSTLLHLIGLLDAPDVGEVQLEGQRIDDLPVRTRDELRNRVFGFVFQFYHLLPELSLMENVLCPLMIRHSIWGYWQRRREYHDRAREMIDRVGLGHRLTHKPSELSGGEMQRAAIARSLVTRPEILLADEPTGNLDRQTAGEVFALMRELNRSLGCSFVIATHDGDIAAHADRALKLIDGVLQAA